MGTLNKNVIIATHSLVYGAPQALRDYLKIKKIDTLFIDHPLFGNPISWGWGLLDAFWQVGRYKKTIDLYIGVDSLNAIVGIILKKIGKVKKIVYYTIDYVPQRFTNPILNSIYHFLDKLCLIYADETWNVSPRISEAREKYKGLKQSIYNKQKVVPIGIWYDKVKRLPFSKIKKHQLFFLGHLLESAGVQVVLKAMPRIIKTIPDFHFLIVGGGNYEQTLKEMARRLKLEKHVTFTGWIKDRNRLDRIMADSAIAVALYDKKTSKTTYYSDPTKLKDYLSAGLPIVLTDLPHNAYEIVHHKCGIIVDYDVGEIAQAVLSLMKDERKLKQFRMNALTYIKNYDWSLIFKKISCLY